MKELTAEDVANALGAPNAIILIVERINAEVVKKNEIQAKADEDKKPHDAEIEKFNEIHRRLTGKFYIGDDEPKPKRGRKPGKQAKAPKAAKAKGKRIRRSLEDVKSEAVAVVHFVKSQKQGATGADIKAKFPGVKGSIKEYVNKYAGVKLKTSGSKASMRYFAK